MALAVEIDLRSVKSRRRAVLIRQIQDQRRGVHYRRWEQVTCAPDRTFERKLTATTTVQWVYSRVSSASLQKTGVFLVSVGDFREFSAQRVRLPVSRDFR